MSPRPQPEAAAREHIDKLVVTLARSIEQSRIVGEVERRLSVVGELEKVVTPNFRRATHASEHLVVIGIIFLRQLTTRVRLNTFVS